MKNINIAEALVVKDGTGLFNPSGCLKIVHCGFRVIGPESLLTRSRSDECGGSLFAGSAVPAATDGSTVDTIKIYDEITKIEMWILASDYHGSLLGGCNKCCSPKLATPGSLALTPDDTEIDLNWADVTNATSYTVERATDAGFVNKTLVYTGSTSAFNDTGLTNGTTYYYRVRALAADYQSSDYATGSAVPAP